MVTALIGRDGMVPWLAKDRPWCVGRLPAVEVWQRLASYRAARVRVRGDGVARRDERAAVGLAHAELVPVRVGGAIAAATRLHVDIEHDA